MEQHRNLRVSEAVREELTEIIGYELEDPRLNDVCVTHVEVSSDGRHAHVKVEAPEGAGNKAIGGLEHASSHLRRELASRLNLRRVPELSFTLDSHPDAGVRVEILLRRAKRTAAGKKPA
jgi:ribosome-binding factor A